MKKALFSVAIALSHKAELLILDEPTSGLDPISRDEILDIFRKIVKDGERAILFSTHITSDLDKCATNITYIHDGEIQYTGTKADFISKYLYVEKQVIQKDLLNKFIASFIMSAWSKASGGSLSRGNHCALAASS